MQSSLFYDVSSFSAFASKKYLTIFQKYGLIMVVNGEEVLL